MTTIWSAPMAAVREAIGATLAQTSSTVPGCCKRAKLVPPETFSLRELRSSRSLAGSVDR